MFNGLSVIERIDQSACATIGQIPAKHLKLLAIGQRQDGFDIRFFVRRIGQKLCQLSGRQTVQNRQKVRQLPVTRQFRQHVSARAQRQARALLLPLPNAYASRFQGFVESDLRRLGLIHSPDAIASEQENHLQTQFQGSRASLSWILAIICADDGSGDRL